MFSGILFTINSYSFLGYMPMPNVGTTYPPAYPPVMGSGPPPYPPVSQPYTTPYPSKI